MKLDAKHVALMGMFIALNVAVGGVVHVAKAPIFLDAIGTVLAVMLLGLVPGAIVGVLSFVLAALLINPVYIYFVGTQAVISLFIYFAAANFSAFKSLQRAVPMGLILGAVAGLVSAPVIVFVFGGVAGSGRDLITAGLMSTGQQVFKAVFLSGLASEPIDKLLQVLACFFILRSLPKRVLTQFRNPLLERNGFI